MILFKRGNISKRIGVLLCALAFVLHLAFVPLRARAFAGVLPAVGAGVVVTAALMASGIYPYEEAKDFAEYVTDNLSSLWQQYIDSFEDGGTPSGGTITTLSQIKGYLTQGVMAIERGVWNALSDFILWVVSHFSVTDNQTDLQLGEVSAVGTLVPVCDMNVSSVLSGGINYAAVPDGGWHYYLGSTVPGACIFYYGKNSVCAFLPNGDGFVVGEALRYTGGGGVSPRFYTIDTSSAGGQSLHVTVDGVLYRVWVDGNHDSIGRNPSIPVYETISDGIRAVVGFSPELSGVTADTTTVSPLAALPADKPWGGLAVEGAGTSATVGTVEQVIQEGVTEREKPEVKVVEVELGAGTDVDTETGEVTENPVVVTPDVVVPAVSELTAPQAFLDTLQSAMQTKFPFCLPFDVMRILSALSRQPQAPLIKLTFHDNFSDADYTIEVDLSPWNGVAAIVREMQSILLLLGFWLNFDKFNVLNIILGQLG